MHISDVIGQVISFHDVQSVHVSGKDKKKVEFRLLDIKYVNLIYSLFSNHLYQIYILCNSILWTLNFSGQSIACCLWGKYVEQLEEHLQKSNDPSMVCLIRFAKIVFYKETLRIRTYVIQVY